MITSSTAIAGQVGGPTGHRDTVLTNSSDSYNITFRGQELAQVLIRGDGSSDLDCFAVDNNGNLVDSDVDFTDTCLLEWNPIWTGKFRITIVNVGNSDNEYSIVTN